MGSINDLVPATTENIERAKELDKKYDLWTARMIRWVQFGWSPKAVVCGNEWEDQQDKDHCYETLEEWRDYYLPNHPGPRSYPRLPTHATSSVSDSVERWNREDARRQRRELAAREKYDAGEDLTSEEQADYDNWVDMEAYREKYLDPPFTERSIRDPTKSQKSRHDDVSDSIPMESTKNPKHPEDREVQDVLGLAVRSTRRGLYPGSPSVIQGSRKSSNQYRLWSTADHIVPEWKDSPPSSRSSSTNDSWGLPKARPGGCTLDIDHFLLKREYVEGVRGKTYAYPYGLGAHIRQPPDSWASWDSIEPEDALDNPPADLAYVFRPGQTKEESATDIKMIEAIPIGHVQEDGDDRGDFISKEVAQELYNEETCHKDGTWLAQVNPEVTLGMVARLEEDVIDRRHDALEMLEALKPIGSNVTLLVAMTRVVLKDVQLCTAIFEQLVKRDADFIKKDDNKSYRLHGRVKTVLSNLYRWAMMDMESAIEDIRLILQDHELVLEILEALNGTDSTRDSLLIDSESREKQCAHCKKPLDELAVLYGRDHRTLMATGCRICEDTRLRKAQQLLWKWHKQPDLLDDAEYTRIFGVNKGLEIPKGGVVSFFSLVGSKEQLR